MKATLAGFWKKHRKDIFVLGGIIAVGVFSLVLDTQDALAMSVGGGTGGESFQTILDTINGWAGGTLGKVICVGMVLSGIAAGIVRSSLWAFACGVGAAVGLANAPDIIESIFSVTYTFC